MKTYGIHDIVPLCNKNPTDYYVGIFEDTEDPDMERNHTGFPSAINGTNVLKEVVKERRR